MAGNTVPFLLRWFDGSKLQSKNINIQFCSMYIDREYPKIIHAAASVLAYSRRITENREEIAKLKADKPEGYKEKIELYNKDIEEKTLFIINTAGEGTDADICKKRYELVKELLQSNGVTDEEILSYEFWDKKVNATTAWDLLELATTKDTPKTQKKKLGLN